MRERRNRQNKAHISLFAFFDEYLIKIFKFFFGDGKRAEGVGNVKPENLRAVKVARVFDGERYLDFAFIDLCREGVIGEGRV